MYWLITFGFCSGLISICTSKAFDVSNMASHRKKTRYAKSVQWPLAFCCLILLNNSVAAQQATKIRVSAVVPPHFCQFPDRCDRVAANATTRVVVQGDSVRYIGSRPVVAAKHGIILLLF